MRSKIILFLALIMGIVTTVLFFNYMKELDTEAAMTENMIEVVVAATDIKENQQISGDMLTVKQIPEVGLHPDAVTDPSQVIGKFTTSYIKNGEILLTHRLKSVKEETLFVSRKIQDGFRAVSVGVNFVQSVSNLIEPEDTVDVIFSEVDQLPDGNINVDTEQILSGARVLAVGRKLIAPTEHQEGYAEYTSVTLELKPEDAVKLVNASERGSIQLTLHSRIVPPQELQSDEN
ncbi:MAG: Flp pilus assembly protein CpaB [Bacillaceae bacterium]|nr:Flp pilus assembly protein CpaB [Bacillaceae bacterium]